MRKHYALKFLLCALFSSCFAFSTAACFFEELKSSESESQTQESISGGLESSELQSSELESSELESSELESSELESSELESSELESSELESSELESSELESSELESSELESSELESSELESSELESSEIEEYVSVNWLDATEYTINGLAEEVIKGTDVEFTIELEKSYSLSVPTVKVNGVIVTPQNGKYTVTANEDLQVTVENLVKYEKISDTPITLPGSTVTTELAHPISDWTNVVPTQYGRVNFIDVELAKYTSIVFFVRAEGGNKWILIKNQENQDLYSNAILDENGGSWVADDVWHKVEMVSDGEA